MPSAATASRPPRIGSGPAHCALEDARDRANLNAFCRNVGCVPEEVSADGIRLDILRALDAMRQRGYVVGQPTQAPCQVRRRATIWHVRVTLPAGGPSCTLGFTTPNTS